LSDFQVSIEVLAQQGGWRKPLLSRVCFCAMAPLEQRVFGQEDHIPILDFEEG
jgi:hypothetical protein